MLPKGAGGHERSGPIDGPPSLSGYGPNVLAPLTINSVLVKSIIMLVGDYVLVYNEVCVFLYNIKYNSTQSGTVLLIILSFSY